ncbi:hypothetical protein EJ06DRAFT_489492 [Trichodelitschia bisporula]|uniref:Aminoacyl-transfer RNA synthetases class-II family profile domain-containing protein n=1 Tax=Trichodelitschia bisporula TaxID=703511 RepID=A0A6G1I3J6_9PEZI|nr:hypothetical protein EJ06DRAFT_489492 [Trichodelitschia bisporula]
MSLMLANLAPRRLVRQNIALWRSYAEVSRYIRANCQFNTASSQILRCNWHQRLNVGSRRPFSDNRLKREGLAAVPDFLEAYKQSCGFPPATHEIGSLSAKDVGAVVVLHGYLGPRKDLSKKLSFVTFFSKDFLHAIQIVSPATGDDGNLKKCFKDLKSLTQHTPVVIRGIIKPREPSKTKYPREEERINDLEVELVDVTPLNSFPKDLMLTDDTNFPPEQRHLQFRNTKALRDALAFRARAADICRDELRSDGFLEIETPQLFKSTPEGAREFLVPTRQKGLVYALPQSPQQYKQILMASGIPKYFQLARCFRDEDLRADRQPEFTQVDLEMSFATGEQVMECIERLLARLWKGLLNIDVPAPFQRITYHNAMAKYGSDKPDLRLGMEMINLSELLPVDLVSKITPFTLPNISAFKLPLSTTCTPSESRTFISTFMDSPVGHPFLTNPHGQPGIFIYDSTRPLSGLSPFGFQTADFVEDVLAPSDGDVIFLQAAPAGPYHGGSTSAGRLRLALHAAAVATDLLPPPQGFEFAWITDFPLFEPVADGDAEPGQQGAAGLRATHHPFTAPKTPADVELLVSDPAAVVAEHYDVVVNGVELGGGSRRIHDARVQEYVMRDVLQMSAQRIEDFRHLLKVLETGCPPHAGIALGFDRLVAVMLGRESVRDVIAFPKMNSGEDALVGSPNAVTKEQLDVYHLRLKE